MDCGKALVDMTPGLIGRDEVGKLLLRVAEDLVEVVLLAQTVDGTKRGKESNYNFDSFFHWHVNNYKNNTVKTIIKNYVKKIVKIMLKQYCMIYRNYQIINRINFFSL